MVEPPGKPKYFISKMQIFWSLHLELLAYDILIKISRHTTGQIFCVEFRYGAYLSFVQTFLPLVFQKPFLKELSSDSNLKTKQKTNIPHSLSQIFLLIPMPVVLFYALTEVTFKKNSCLVYQPPLDFRCKRQLHFLDTYLRTAGGVRSFSDALMAMEANAYHLSGDKCHHLCSLRSYSLCKIWFLKGMEEIESKVLIEFLFWDLVMSLWNFMSLVSTYNY